MTTRYHVYKNDLLGGPIDYTTPIATTSGTSVNLAAPGASKDASYAVRAFDVGSGLEERNVDARVRVVTDGAGVDVTNRPSAPSGLTATATAGGTAQVAWQYPRVNPGGTPTGFHVYLGTPTPAYGSPALTVPYDGRATYQASLAGLADGVAYQVAVRAYNASAEEPNAVVAAVTGDATGPLPVDDLAGSVTSAAPA
jgi:hypothetical protein